MTRLDEAKKKHAEEKILREDKILIKRWGAERGLFREGQLEQLATKNFRKARNTARILENTEKMLSRMTESQVSDVFQVTPQTIVKVINLTAVNDIRADIFNVWAMSGMKDSIYRVQTAYASGAYEGQIMRNTLANFDYPTEMVNGVALTHTEATTAFSLAAVGKSVRRNSIAIYLNGELIATDNGIAGTGGDANKGRLVGDGIALGALSFVDYTTGEIGGTLATASPAGATMTADYGVNTEDPSQYDDIKRTQISLRAYDFQAKPQPMAVEWSHMTALMMDDQLKMGAERTLISGASREMVKAQGFRALRKAKTTSAWASSIDFDTDWVTQGAASSTARAQDLKQYIDRAGHRTNNAIGHGTISHLICGAIAHEYLTKVDGYKRLPNVNAVGSYQTGTYDGMPVFLDTSGGIVPEAAAAAGSTNIAPDEIITVYKNNDEDANDASLSFGVFLPIGRFDGKLVHPSKFYSEAGLVTYEDEQVLQDKYVNSIKLLNTSKM